MFLYVNYGEKKLLEFSRCSREGTSIRPTDPSKEPGREDER